MLAREKSVQEDNARGQRLILSVTVLEYFMAPVFCSKCQKAEAG